MKINFKNGENFDNLNIEIDHAECDDINLFFKSTNREFSFSLDIDGAKHSGLGVRGDDAIWLPLNDYYGIKLITENEKYHNLEETLKNIEYIETKQSNIFPDIEWCEKNKNYIICMLENVVPYDMSKISSKELKYLPPGDVDFAQNMLMSPSSNVEYATNELLSLALLPEDEWYKSINFINGKIVDFHRFKLMPERYALRTNGKTVKEIEYIYKNIVSRYKNVLDSNNVPKWKGKIYQGFVFDNGAHMPGYSSDTFLYDSYRKLPFIPYNKVQGKKVLDLGSNQGFFSFQAALHGASEVTGVELQKEDVLASEDINEIVQFDNVTFINGDAKNYLLETQEKYSLVIANSVIHQICPNFEGAGELFDKISKCSDYFSFETPVNHPLMKMKISEIYETLSHYFKVVRLLNIYDAYSSGYRANFVCYS